LGKILIENRGRELVFRTRALELPVAHWHLETFVVEYAPWHLREFAEFRIGPDGEITGIRVFGEDLVRSTAEAP
jgi:hypothetical protein